MRRRTFLGGVLGGLVGLSGCTSVLGSGSTGTDFDVGMRASAFVPVTYEVSVGDTVVWYNNNSRAHTVTAYENSLPEGATYFASGGFDSEAAAREGYGDGLKGAIYSGERYEHTFEVSGEYGYFCIPHERAGMTGKIVVTE